jgi:hypothetical protein
MRTIRAILAVAVVLAMVGCSGLEPLDADRPRDPGSTVEVPTYAELRARYNDRVDGLERLWARAVVQVDGEDAEGNKLKEQAEGHLQVIRPDRVALTLGKLGETYFMLGSNPRNYWWIDLSAEPKSALVGAQDRVTPEAAAYLGLPIYPGDLIELFGIAPLPEEPAPVGRAVYEQLVAVDLPAATGTKRLLLDPETLEPQRIELIDRSGRLAAASELSRYEMVPVEGDALRKGRVATRVLIRSPQLTGTARFTLNEPTNKSIRSVAFDLTRILKSYSVSDVVDVDELVERAGTAASAEEPR